VVVGAGDPAGSPSPEAALLVRVQRPRVTILQVRALFGGPDRRVRARRDQRPV